MWDSTTDVDAFLVSLVREPYVSRVAARMPNSGRPLKSTKQFAEAPSSPRGVSTAQSFKAGGGLQ